MKAGSIIFIDLEPTVGNEKRNHGKKRRCVVIAFYENQGLLAILPITDKESTFGNLFVEIMDTTKAGLTKPSKIDCLQIRIVSIKRIMGNVLGYVSKNELFKAKKSIALALGIESEHI